LCTVVLKLGGSLITWKEKPLKPRVDVISRISKEIGRALRKRETLRLVIVHGGGSYGHPYAYKYKIHEGLKPDQSKYQVYGLGQTTDAMRKLSLIISESLRKEGIPVFPIQASSISILKDGRIDKFFQEPLEMLLKIGAVPLLWGDVALDVNRGFGIVSGDELSVKLAVTLNASKIIFTLDIDGIYTKPPGTNGAQLIRYLRPGMENVDYSVRKRDVTGGVMRKIVEAEPLVSAGKLVVLFINGLVEGRVEKALLGEQVVGTIYSSSSPSLEPPSR